MMKLKHIISVFIITLVLLLGATFIETTFDMPITSQTTVKAATFGQKQARKKAKSYLKIMAFSKKGLINQLKFEGFSTKEAKYGVNHCKANWKKQAVRKAKKYLSIMAFSKSNLISQLRYDGFTMSQAKYAVKKVGY